MPPSEINASDEEETRQDAKEETVFVVDDDPDVRDSLASLLSSANFRVETFDSARSFLTSDALSRTGCLVADVRMPDMDGLELQEEIGKRKSKLPVIIITGHGDVPLAVRAMKAGAVDFLEKPFEEDRLIESIRRAFATGSAIQSQAKAVEAVSARIAQLTGREREVLSLVVAGRANKEIARALNISPRTVEIHRAHVMEKMEAESLAELVRLTMKIADNGASPRIH
jgi:two-component system response regulator FixJ